MDQQRHHKQMDYLERALQEATGERDEVMSRISQLKRKLDDLQSNQMLIEQKLSEKNDKLKVGVLGPTVWLKRKIPILLLGRAAFVR